MGVEVPATHTAIDPSAMLEQVGRSHFALYGAYPTREFGLTLIGQCFTECGDLGKDCWDWNVGNVQKTNGFDWDELRGAWEIRNGVRVNQPEDFRAFHSLDEGVTQHIAFLKTGAGGRYAEAFALAMKGDAAGFARALKSAGYYSGSVDDYVRLLTYFVQKYKSIPTAAWELDAQDAAAPVDGAPLPAAPNSFSLPTPLAKA